jgi:hypothetical protein
MKTDDKIIDLEVKRLVIEEQEKLVIKSSGIIVGIVIAVIGILGTFTRNK